MGLVLAGVPAHCQLTKLGKTKTQRKSTLGCRGLPFQCVVCVP